MGSTRHVGDVSVGGAVRAIRLFECFVVAQVVWPYRVSMVTPTKVHRYP